MDQQIESKQRTNAKLDKQIQNVNFTVAELNLARDAEQEELITKRKKDR